MHLTQVCLWEKVLNYEKRFFGLGHVCKLNGLEDFCRVNFTEVVLGDCKRLDLYFLDLAQCFFSL